MRYLIVDDNQAFAENLAEILRDGGSTVDVAASGAQALAMLGGARYDAVVTDMRMPMMNGAVLVHELRQIDPGLPAVVVTAHTQETDLADARHEGVLAVLPKPTPISTLEALLKVAKRDGLVALVEDDSTLADNLSEALRARGFTALTAHSVLEAERLGDVRPFVALVDLRLPDAPRGEVLERLKKRFPDLPQVVVTGHLEAMPAGSRPESVFTKPFDTEALLAEVEQLHRRAHR